MLINLMMPDGELASVPAYAIVMVKGVPGNPGACDVSILGMPQPLRVILARTTVCTLIREQLE